MKTPVGMLTGVFFMLLCFNVLRENKVEYISNAEYELNRPQS